jgi:hypothetical protein
MSEARAIFDKPISDLTFEPLCSGFFFLQLHPEPRHICKKSLKASSIEPPRLLTMHDIHLYSVHIQHINSYFAVTKRGPGGEAGPECDKSHAQILLRRAG